MLKVRIKIPINKTKYDQKCKAWIFIVPLNSLLNNDVFKTSYKSRLNKTENQNILTNNRGINVV